MNGTEGLTISDWVNDTLAGDAPLQALLGGTPAAAALRIIAGVAPTGTAFPYVNFVVGPEGRIVGAISAEVMARFTISVKAVGKGPSYSPLIPVVQRFHALLAGAVNRVTPLGTVLSVIRVGALQYPERDQGIEYRHLGGLYQINVQ